MSVIRIEKLEAVAGRAAGPSGSPRRVRPPGIEIRFCGSGDVEGLNRLYNDPAARPSAAVVGYVPRTSEQWAWEYAASAGGRPAYSLATHVGRIIGMQAYIPIELLVDGRIVMSGKDEDTLVHPDFRGMGVLDDMYRLLFQRAVDDGVAVMWGFTNTAVRPLLRNGYRSIGRFDALRAEVSALGKGPAGTATVRELREPDAHCDRFSLEFGRRVGGVMLHLSARYLQWRLFENPYRSSKVYAAWVGDRLVGLSVLKLDRERRTGFISELAALPTEGGDLHGTLHALLEPGVQLFRSLGYRSVEARFSGPHPFNESVRSVLTARGFSAVSNDHASEFLVRTMGTDDKRLTEMKAWRISELMREY